MLSVHGDVTSLPELVETQGALGVFPEPTSSPMETSVVQDVFNNSTFKHIRTTKTREDLGRSDPEMEI